MRVPPAAATTLLGTLDSAVTQLVGQRQGIVILFQSPEGHLDYYSNVTRDDGARLLREAAKGVGGNAPALDPRKHSDG